MKTVVKFAENNTDGLECTRLWLRRNFEKLLAAEREQDLAAALPVAGAQDAAGASSSPLPSSSSSTSSPASKATPANILNEAYIETLSWDTSNIYPEVYQWFRGVCSGFRCLCPPDSPSAIESVWQWSHAVKQCYDDSDYSDGNDDYDGTNSSGSSCSGGGGGGRSGSSNGDGSNIS